MSDYRVMYGFIGELENSLSSLSLSAEQIEDLPDSIQFNYGETLVYSREFREPMYEFEMLLGMPTGLQEFLKSIDTHPHIRIKENTVQPYIVLWYDGVDCPLDELTVENFRERVLCKQSS